MPLEGANWLRALGYSEGTISQLDMLASDQDYTYRFAFTGGIVQAVALKNQGVITMTGGVRAPFVTVGIDHRRVADHLEIFNPGGAPSLTATEVLTREEAIQAGILIPAEEKPEEEPTPPLITPKAFFRIFSTPSGGRVFIDDVDTGQQTMTAPIEVLPGMRKIEVKALEGYVDTQVTRLARAGETRDIEIPLASLADKPTEEPPPAEISPREQFKSPLTQIVNALGLETPGFLAAWDEFIGAVTDIFGTSFPQFVIDETTGELVRLPDDKKILFIVNMKAPVNAGATAAQEAIKTMTVGKFMERAQTNPKEFAQFLKSLPQDLLGQFYDSIRSQRMQQHIIDTGARIILPVAKKNAPNFFGLSIKTPSPLQLAALTYGSAGLATWLSTDNFLWHLTGGITQLLKPGTAKEALQAIAESRQYLDMSRLNPLWNALADFLMLGKREPVIAGAYRQLDQWEITARNMIEITEVGEIGITTDPPKAVVIVDGIQHTFPTPTVISKLLPGDHTVLLELEGYVDHKELIEVEAQGQAKIDHTFEQLPSEITPRTGQLQVAMFDKKTGATLIGTFYINGNIEKATAHAIVLDILPGPVEIRLEALGYETWEDTVVIDLDTPTKVIAELKKFVITEPDLPPDTPPPDENGDEVPKTGRLEVNSNVAANILIGGVDTGKKTPSGFDLTQGIYSVTLEAEGFISRGTTTLVKTGETSTVSLELRATDEPPPKRRLAKVSINSEPTGAKILVNGVWTKQYTPDSVLLEAGEYEISLTKSGFKTWRTPLRLVEGS